MKENIMKRYITTAIVILVFPHAAQAQSDLRKIGKFLEGIQQLQNQQGNQQSGGQQDRPRTYKSDPNQSGRQNQGDFNRPGFIVQPGTTYPRPYNPNPQITYPSQPYPQQNTYPPGTIVQRPAYGEPPTAPRRTYSNLPIQIRCSPDCVGTCNYQLVSGSGKGFPYTIRPNQTQTLKETTDWLCRYQPITGGAYQTYRLRGGKTYEMRRDNNRWQLYMVP